MSETTTRATVPCPHPGCEALLRLQPTLPEGTYRCICRACQVRLTWTTFLCPPRRTPWVRCACGRAEPPAEETP